MMEFLFCPVHGIVPKLLLFPLYYPEAALACKNFLKKVLHTAKR